MILAQIRLLSNRRRRSGLPLCFRRRRDLALIAGLAWSLAALAQTPADLTQASLEDLMNIQVTSVSKREQRLSKTGAAVFVITQEDIERSGARDLPMCCAWHRA